MKKILLSSLMAAAAAMPAFAGVDNINYQAVIKNGNQIVANSQVDMKFELLDNETVVYSEEQSMTTNASGLVSCQLGGEGLNTIEWGDLTLRVSINFGSGYEVLSNETVSSVPTALYALRSADSDNLKEEIDDFANMVETRIDKIQTQLDYTDSDLENIKENLTNAFNEKDAEIAEINGQLENLNMVAAVVRENEATIEEISQFNQRVSEELAKLQGLDADEINDFNQRISDEIARINDALTLLHGDEFVAYVSQLNALKAELEEKLEAIKPFSDIAEDVTELKGQVENLNMVAAVVRENEAAVEELNTNVDAMATMVETRIDKLQNQVDNEVAEINGQLENLNNVAAVTRANEEAIENLTEQVDAFATMNETRIDKLQKQVDTLEADIVPEIEGLIKDNEETKANIRSISADVAQVEGLAEKVEMLEESMAAIASPSDPESMMNQINNAMGELGETVEGLVKDNEETKANIRSISADVAQVEGLAEKVEMLEESMAAIASPSDPESMMNQINTAMGELGDAVEGLVQENEETKSRLNAISADVAQIEGLAKDVEALHEQTDDFATMLETRIDKIQNQVDGLEEEVTTLKDTLNQLIEALRDLDILPTLFNAGK